MYVRCGKVGVRCVSECDKGVVGRLLVDATG